MKETPAHLLWNVSLCQNIMGEAVQLLRQETAAAPVGVEEGFIAPDYRVWYEESEKNLLIHLVQVEAPGWPESQHAWVEQQVRSALLPLGLILGPGKTPTIAIEQF